MDFVAKAYNIKGYETRAEELFNRFDLLDKKDKLGKELSKGMQQKVSIIISTHIIDSIAGLWDRAFIMKDGKTIYEKSKEDLAESHETLEEVFFRATGI